MEDVVLEVNLRGFEPHEKSNRYRWVLPRDKARERLQLLFDNADTAVISYKFYRIVEEK